MENATRFKIFYIPQFPMPAFEREYEDFETAKEVLNAIINFSIFEYDNNVKPDYSDVAGISYWDDEADEGYEWEDVDEELWEEPYE